MSALALRGHVAHLVVFGVPVAVLVGAVGVQEIRSRWGKRSCGEAGEIGSQVRVLDDSLGARSVGLRVASAGLVAAGAIHAIVLPEHFGEYALYGLFFAALSAAQVMLAVVLARRSDARTVRYIGLGSVGMLVLWLVSRTSGLPIGPEPWRPESFGGLDIAASCAELATALGCVTHLWTIAGRRPSLGRPSELLA